MSSDDDVIVEQDGDDWWVMRRDPRSRSVGRVPIRGPFESNAAAWRWLDDNGDHGRDDTDRHNRIRARIGGEG